MHGWKRPPPAATTPSTPWASAWERARGQYGEAKALDDALFGEDFETA